MARHDEYDDDDRVLIVERESGSAFGTFLLGLALGAGAALLFAPASGEETRQRLQEEARRAGKRVREMTDELTEELSEQVERTRSVIDDRVSQAKNAVTSRARAVGEAAQAGKDAAKQARVELERAVSDTKQAYADSRRAYKSTVDDEALPEGGTRKEGKLPGGTPGEG